MRTLNLGILAHVDAGKTSLTERLLYAAGVIDEIGSVDDGSTQTDSLALERQRGITIKSAVVSFLIKSDRSGDVTVNLIDTPGHPDFIAEVERVLSVLDGAVLVISAVEGVQAQTRVLMRTLRRLGIPTLIFVNKIDRSGAQDETLLQSIADKLRVAVLPMGAVTALGTRQAAVTPYADADGPHVARLTELLAEHDEAFLTRYVNDQPVPYPELCRGLARLTRQGRTHPVFFGSAITGAGVAALTAGLTELLPARVGDQDAPVAGTVFKVERGPAGEKVGYVRLFAGTVHIRDRLLFGGDREGKVTALSVFARGAVVPATSTAAGEIAKVWGLGAARIGDSIGTAQAPEAHWFAPPTLETVVTAVHDADRGALHAALSQLAEQDPLINFRQDPTTQLVSVSLYGEVQKEVIEATLAAEFGIAVTFRETTTICIERPIGSGQATTSIFEENNEFLAGVGLRIEPAPIDSGVAYGLAGEVRGTMPPAFFRAVEETVYEALQSGLYGWRVIDCAVTLTHTGYAPRQSHAHAVFDKSMSSTAGDFRNLTPLVLRRALAEAGTRVHEPIQRFQLEMPADALGPLLPVLARLGAIPHTPTITGPICVLDGQIPAARVHELTSLLPGLTQGEGVLESEFDHYEPARAVTGASRAQSSGLGYF